MKKIYIDKRVTVSGKQNTLDTSNNLDLNKHIESVVEELDLGANLPYKKYVAVISQTGESAPTAIILENTLGEVPTWSYVDPTKKGTYALTSVDPKLFEGYVGVFFSSTGKQPFEGMLGQYAELSGGKPKYDYQLNFYSANVDGTGNRNLSDGLFNCMIEIRVYPLTNIEN